jgi:hypothetical protein
VIAVANSALQIAHSQLRNQVHMISPFLNEFRVSASGTIDKHWRFTSADRLMINDCF